MLRYILVDMSSSKKLDQDAAQPTGDLTRNPALCRLETAIEGDESH